MICKLTCSVRTIQYFTWYHRRAPSKVIPTGGIPHRDSLSSFVCSSGLNRDEQSCYARLIVLIRAEKFDPPTLISNSFVLFQYFIVLSSVYSLSSREMLCEVLNFSSAAANLTQQSVCRLLRTLWSPSASSLLAPFPRPLLQGRQTTLYYSQHLWP